ncbi:hypothetical protein MMC31_003580 [Peltigera leucophlebia]|nr:hypothetical protein [Peltigera leucophlebia]
MMHLTDITGKPLGQESTRSQDRSPIRPDEPPAAASYTFSGPTAPAAAVPRNSRDCLFLAPALDSASQMKLTEIKDKMGSLERVLEQDVAKKGSRPGLFRNPQAADGEDIDLAPEPEDEGYLEETPLALTDNAYDDDADDDLSDLGFVMGKMRLTERVGGYFRPKMAEELTVTLNDERNDHRSPEERGDSSDPPCRYHGSSLSNTFMGPGPTYLAPSSGFLFSHSSSPASWIDFLPSKSVADRLLNQYWNSVHPISRLVHKPSFIRRYNTFWEEIRSGIEPVGSLQAVVFSAMFSAVVSLPEENILMEFGVSKKDLVGNFQMGTEGALARANIIRTIKIETLQAFVMYMIPLCRAEVSRSHSALCGTGIRIAQCMGLHRDGTEYSLGPVETQVRRMIWYQLCFMDIRTCEAQGPRPGIRKSEYDTKFPLNVDDDALESPIPPTEDSPRWTDMTLSLIRWECIEMHRVIWVDRPRLEKKKITLTALLGKVENFRRMMREKYIPMIDDSIPVQREGRLLCELLTLRMHAMVLHKYHNSVTQTMPDRLRQLMIVSGVEAMEAAIELETSPDLRPWAWYTGAHQQYHIGFLLLLEIFAFPMRKEADRIWACLDYIFEVPPQLSRENKGRWIITQVRDKTAIYQGARKTRAPTGLTDQLRARQPSPQDQKSQQQQSSRVSLEKIQPVDSSSSPADQNRSQQQQQQHVIPSTHEFSRQEVIASIGEAAYRQIQPNQLNHGQPPAVVGHPAQGNFDSKAPGGNFPPESVPKVPPLQPSLQLAAEKPMLDIDWYEWDKLFPPHTAHSGVGTINMMDPVHPNISQHRSSHR